MRWQTCVAAVVPILVLAAGLCEAQTDGQGFLLVGAGGYSNTYSSGRVHQLVVGGEAITPQNIGLGGEVELAAGGGDAWFALSVNATRHLLQRSDGRATPFLTAGYTRLITLTEQRGRNAVNVGMGARYAVTHRNSVLLELRDLIFQGAGLTNVWTVRAGLGWQ